MILWIMRGRAITYERGIAEVQLEVTRHGSVTKYAQYLSKNAPWKRDENDMEWMQGRWEGLKQDAEEELRRRFYGFP